MALRSLVCPGPCSVGLLRANRSRGQHANGTGQHGAFIAQNIAEHVLHYYDVETLRVEYELHRAVVDQQMIELDIRIIRRDFRHHATPKLRDFDQRRGRRRNCRQESG